MVNLKKYSVFTTHFVLFLTFLFFFSCSQKKYYVTKIESKQYPVTDSIKKNSAIENYIKPYQERINNEMDKKLSYAPITIDKIGTWQTPIGNFLADITLKKCNAIFYSRENKSIDFCLLNIGGIRSIIPQGNVTTKVAYEVMPFENSAVVISLKGEQIIELVNYIIINKKAHPISGITFTIDSNGKPKNILIQDKPLDMSKLYYVLTSDYLANGGDNMIFFKKGVSKFDLDYKLRSIIIDYFTETDTIKANNNIRIFVE